MLIPRGKMTREERLFLLMLGDLFIMLRGTERDLDYSAVRRIADLFHNLPFGLQSGRFRENHEEAWQNMLMKADHLGIDREWLLSLRHSAENCLERI